MFDDFCRITNYYTVVRNVFHNNASGSNFYVIANTDFTQHASMTPYGYVITDGWTSAFSAADCFPSYIVGMIQVGEKTGRLEEALMSLVEYYVERVRIDRVL